MPFLTYDALALDEPIKDSIPPAMPDGGGTAPRALALAHLCPDTQDRGRKPRSPLTPGTASPACQGDACQVRLVHDRAHDEVFAICPHDVTSSPLQSHHYAGRDDWRAAPRRHFARGIWELIDSGDPDEYAVLDEAWPGRALTARAVLAVTMRRG